MPLTQCRKCGNPISTESKKCPKCGEEKPFTCYRCNAPGEWKSMKFTAASQPYCSTYSDNVFVYICSYCKKTSCSVNDKCPHCNKYKPYICAICGQNTRGASHTSDGQPTCSSDEVLIHCRECGAHISSTVSTCYHCGCEHPFFCEAGQHKVFKDTAGKINGKTVCHPKACYLCKNMMASCQLVRTYMCVGKKSDLNDYCEWEEVDDYQHVGCCPSCNKSFLQKEEAERQRKMTEERMKKEQEEREANLPWNKIKVFFLGDGKPGGRLGK